jgi:DNA end-binding protein Ku
MRPVVQLAEVTEFPRPNREPEQDLEDELPFHSQGEPNAKREERFAAFDYAPVRQVLQSDEGEKLHERDVVKGYEVAPDQFAMIDPEEVRQAGIETSDSIDLFHFVPGADVDPIYFERSYYLVPDRGAEKAYALLLAAMQAEGCVGIARVAMHRREHILILRPREHYILAHTMIYANEIRPAPDAVDPGPTGDRELTVARALLRGYTGEFQPEKFQDIYQERLKAVITAAFKREQSSGGISAVQNPSEPVPDLMESIKLSLAQIEATKNAAVRGHKKSSRNAQPPQKKKPLKAS